MALQDFCLTTSHSLIRMSPRVDQTLPLTPPATIKSPAILICQCDIVAELPPEYLQVILLVIPHYSASTSELKNVYIRRKPSASLWYIMNSQWPPTRGKAEFTGSERAQSATKPNCQKEKGERGNPWRS